jgi:hypothetical protein
MAAVVRWWTSRVPLRQWLTACGNVGSVGRSNLVSGGRWRVLGGHIWRHKGQMLCLSAFHDEVAVVWDGRGAVASDGGRVQPGR